MRRQILEIATTIGCLMFPITEPQPAKPRHRPMLSMCSIAWLSGLDPAISNA